MSDEQMCELEGCKSRGEMKRAVGRFQVYDATDPNNAIATMTRPALMCAKCIHFAGKCGMTAVEE